MAGPKDRQQDQKDAKRAAAAERRATKRRDQGKVNVAGLPWLTLAALVAEMAETGGAIRIGLTRDGGALALGMYHGDDYATEYIRPNEDVEGALFGIADLWLPDGLLGLERRMAQMGTPKQP
jgi:hypothetical protein